MMLISCTKLFMNARIAPKIGRSIQLFFLVLLLVGSPILSSTAKSTAKYFIIDAELQGHLDNLAEPILLKAGVHPESLKIFII